MLFRDTPISRSPWTRFVKNLKEKVEYVRLWLKVKRGKASPNEHLGLLISTKNGRRRLARLMVDPIMKRRFESVE